MNSVPTRFLNAVIFLTSQLDDLKRLKGKFCFCATKFRPVTANFEIFVSPDCNEFVAYVKIKRGARLDLFDLSKEVDAFNQVFSTYVSTSVLTTLHISLFCVSLDNGVTSRIDVENCNNIAQILGYVSLVRSTSLTLLGDNKLSKKVLPVFKYFDLNQVNELVTDETSTDLFKLLVERNPADGNSRKKSIMFTYSSIANLDFYWNTVNRHDVKSVVFEKGELATAMIEKWLQSEKAELKHKSMLFSKEENMSITPMFKKQSNCHRNTCLLVKSHPNSGLQSYCFNETHPDSLIIIFR